MAKVTINQLYDNLKEDGWVEKDFDNFKQFFFAAGEQGYKNRKALYDNMREDGYVDSPTYEDFMDKIDYKVGKSHSTSVATPMAQAVEESSSAPTEVTEQSSVQPQKPWQPSLQDRLRASWDIAQGVNNFKQGNKAAREKVKRQAEIITPEGRQKAKVAKASAKLVGADVEAPLFGGAGSNAGDATTPTTPARQPASAQSPQVASVKFDENGQPITEWMLPDCTLTTDRQQVGAAEERARASRLQHEFKGRMREKGLDPSKPEDVQKQAIYEEVGQELEDAYREKEALEAALNKRKEELDKEHDNVGLGTRILRGLSEAAISSKDPHAIRDDNEARNYTADKQYNQLTAAIRHNRQAINILEDKRRGRMNEFWLNLGKEMVNGYTFDYGKGQLNDSRALNDAADLVDTINEKRRKGEALNEEEQTAELLLTSLARRNDTEGRFGGDYGAWARAGKMASHSIELLPDFAMGGMSLMQSVTTKSLAKMGLKEVAKGFGNKVMRATGIGLGTLAGGAVMTNTIHAPRLLGQTAANMDGQLRMDSDGNYIIDGKEGFMTSFLKAQRELISENASEAVGEFLPSGKFVRELVGKGLEKIGLSKLNNTFASIGGKEWYQNTNIALKQMGFNGTVNEGLEEYAGIGYQTLMGDGDAFRSLADWDTHIDIWLGTVTMGALLNTPQYIGTAAYGAQYAKAKHGLNKNDKAGASVYGERWEGIKSQIDGMQNENVAGVLITMLTDGTASTKEERQALLDYAGNLQRMRGLNIGQMMGGSAQDAEVAQTYSSGYEASTPQEMVDAQNMYEYQRQRLVNELGSIGEENIENILAEVESDPVGALNKTYDPALRDIVMDYANAKTVRDGMIQRVNDDIDEQIAQSNAIIDGRINKESGLIVPATMGLDDRQVYVVSGNIVANEDGSIDRDASDESFIVRDAQTGKLEWSDPRSLSSLGEAIDPEEERATATEAIRQQYAQSAVDAMNGTLAFNPGDIITIDNNGTQVTVIGLVVDAETGMAVENQVVVQLPDGNQSAFTKEELQQWSDAANLERLNNFEQERNATRAQQQAAEAEANYEQGDSFKVTIENSEDTQHAIVMDQEGEAVTIWTPYPINERSDVASTMDGYITDVPRGELASIIERDEQGNLVDYVAANPQDEIVGNAVINGDNSVNLQHGNGPEQNNDERAQPREADGGPVAPDPAGSLETSRDRSDIRVYEDGLAAKYNDYSEHSERDRREAESERLVGIAKSKGQYYDRKRIETLGEKRPKPSGESEIYVDAPKRRIYKVKNPYAKSPMKGNVQPEDAIYEHLVHNKYFPETAYKFEGISDDLGDARIVLSQELVESVGQATKEQIDAALAEKGLLPEGKYTYGNDEISVTDVTGDNALLGNDGKVYFIDPIINFKKPVSEILGEIPAAEAAAPNQSEEIQPTALSRIPVDEEGEPLFDQTDPATAWDGMTEYFGGPEDAIEFARSRVKTLKDEKDRLAKAVDNIKATGSAKEFKDAKAKARASLAAKQAQLDHWNNVVNAKIAREQADAEAQRKAEEAERAERQRQYEAQMRRQREAEIAAEESRRQEMEQKAAIEAEMQAEAERQAQLPENQERERAVNSFEEYIAQMRQEIMAAGAGEQRQRLSERIRTAAGAKQYGDIYAALSDDNQASTTSLEEWVTRQLSVNKQRVKWNGDGNLRGQMFTAGKKEKVSEVKQLQWMISDRDGIPFWDFVHKMWETLLADDSAGFNREGITDQDVRNMVIEVLRSHPTSRSLFDSAIDMYDTRMAGDTMQGELQQMEHDMDDIRDEWYSKNLGMTYDEYNTRVEAIYSEIRRSELTDEDIDAINSEIADEQQNINDNGNDNEGALRSGAESVQAEQSDWRAGDASPDVDRPETTGRGSDSESGGVAAETGKFDKTGNPIDENGKLLIVDVATIDDIADDDFINPTRTIGLPPLPEIVSDAIGAGKKKVIIKKHILEKNRESHKDLTSADSREILKTALYTPQLYGQNQKLKRPYNWILIHLADKNTCVLLEVNNSKDNCEIVNWHYLGEPQLKQKERQAEREGGRILTLSMDSAAGNTSRGLSSESKDNALLSDKQGDSEKSLPDKIAAAEAEVNIDPTDAQKAAGNYKMGHVKIDGLDISIENPKGSIRSGKDANGKAWETKMNNTYGYIRGTTGVDGDKIDVFLSENPAEGDVYVVDQYNSDGSFDEHKVMYGFTSADEAKGAYLSNYSADWADGRKIEITGVTREEFRKWLDASDRKTKPFAEYKSVKPINPSGNKLVTDERYAELRERMRKKFGQFNMGVDPEILAIGTEMAVYHIEKGARKFTAYASAMIADLGDAIRPYLKAFYNAVRDMPEAEDAGLIADMDSYEDVRKVDIANFDKTSIDAMVTAAAVIEEQKIAEAAEEAGRLNSRVDEYAQRFADFLSIAEEDLTQEAEDSILREREALTQEIVDYYLRQSVSIEEAEKQAEELIGSIQSQTSAAVARKLQTEENVQNKLAQENADEAEADRAADLERERAAIVSDEQKEIDEATAERNEREADLSRAVEPTQGMTEAEREAATLNDAIAEAAESETKTMSESEDNQPSTADNSSQAISEEDLRKLDEADRKALKEYLEVMPTAPISVISDARDIEESGLSDEAKTALQGIMESGEVSGAYCKDDKKIYIFAGNNESGPQITLHSLLLHENAHALADADELIDSAYLKRFADAIERVPLKHYRDLRDRLRAAGYEDKELADEVFAVAFQTMFQRPKRVERLRKELSPADRNIFDELLTRYYNGKGRYKETLIHGFTHLVRPERYTQSGQLGQPEREGRSRDTEGGLPGGRNHNADVSEDDGGAEGESRGISGSASRAAGGRGHSRLNEGKSAADNGVLEPEAEHRKFSDKIEATFNAAVAGELKGKPVEIGRLTVEGRAYLEKLSGMKLKENVRFKLNPSDLVHIYKNHYGVNEKDPGQNIPLTTEDIRKMADVLVHPDKVIFGVEKDGDRRKMFFFLKSDAESGAYNLLEIYANAWGNLTSKSYYRTKKSVSQRVLSLKKSEHLTSVTDGPTLNSGANLPKFFDISTSREQESSDILERQGDGYGAYSDAEVSYLNDTASKLAGKNRFSKKRQAEFAARERQRMADRIQELAENLHLNNVEVLTDTSQLEGKRAEAKGFFNKRTGKITIVLPNNYGKIDAEQTLLHEAVAHYGLRKLFGKHFDTFLNNVYESAEPEIRRKIATMAAKYGWDFRTATEEYLAGLAEDTNFDEARAYGGWWSRIKRLFLDMLEKIGFEGFRDNTGIVITDNELRYLLWRSYENLRGRDKGIFRDAADVVKQVELKVGNYAEGGIEADYAAEPTDVGSINAQFNQELQQYENGTLPKGHRFELGMPSAYLRSAGFPMLPINMRASLLKKKSQQPNHPFESRDIKNLVEAIQKPIAIFHYTKENVRNLIVDIEVNNKHFLVGVTLDYKAGDIEINSISGLFPKQNHEWLKWIQDGKAIRIDQKEKVQAIIDSLRINPGEAERIGLNLDDAAKIVKSFENPTVEGEELFRPGDFTPRDKVLARDEYERMVSRSSFQAREAIQDSMLGLKELYKAISESEASAQDQEFRIEEIAGFENAYLFENRMSSINAAEQHEYFLRYMKPLLKEIAKIAGADKRKRMELTDYLMAKHGLERNEYMRNEAAANGEETERDFAGLTGLTGEADWRTAEATAQQWVADYETATDTSALWQAVNKATQATLERIYHSGIISKENYEKILGMYQYYIPLRGWNETTSEEVYGYLTSKDGPLGGSIMKKAEGRSSKADDPIATIAMMADDAIRQGNRNLMKQRFLNFILNHPSDAVSVHDIWLEYDDVADEWRPVFADVNATDTADEVARKVEAFEQRMEALQKNEPDKYKRGREAQHIPYKVVNNNLREHQVLIKRNGRTFVATINGNPRAAQAINGLTNPDVDQNGIVGNMLKAGSWLNRQLSAFYTTRNPDFVVGNFFRDMLYSNCMTWVKESPRYALRFHKNFGRVNPAAMRRLLGKWENGKLDMSNRLESLFYQFMKNGGETGYTNVRDIDSHKKAVAAELKKQGNIGRKVWSALGMQLDLLNRSAENCARFAAFVTSREFGRSIDRSIYDAKEVSVNFNKKGSGGKMVNAVGQTTLGKAASYLGGGGRLLYVFWNAGIQGFTNFGRQAKLHPAKFTAGAAALFTLGYVIPMLAQMVGGGDGDDDDRNAYYNLPEYIRRSNICFKAGEQWIAIPLPIEYRAMYGMGELAHGVISGNERYSNSELAYQMASQVSQILPLDMLEGGGGISPFIPSAAKPFTEAYIMNKGWTGLPIYKDTPFNKNEPEWTKAYASTDKHLVSFAKWLNETTGGDDFTKGIIDINPAKIEYLLNGTFGGLFTFPNKIKKTGETMFGDRDFEWRNIPIANRLIKSGDERTAFRKLQNEYFKYKEESEETARRLRKYQKADEEGLMGYAEKVNFLENSPEYLRYEIFGDFKDDIAATKEAREAEPNETKAKSLEAEYYGTMRELVDALHEPSSYFKKLYDAGQLNDEYINFLEKHHGIKFKK